MLLEIIDEPKMYGSGDSEQTVEKKEWRKQYKHNLYDRIFVLHKLHKELEGSTLVYYLEELDITSCEDCFGYEITGNPNNSPTLKYPYTESDKPDKILVSFLQEHLPEEVARLLPKQQQ